MLIHPIICECQVHYILAILVWFLVSDIWPRQCQPMHACMKCMINFLLIVSYKGIAYIIRLTKLQCPAKLNHWRGLCNWNGWASRTTTWWTLTTGLQNFSSIICSKARSVLARHSDFLFKSYFSLKNVTSHAYIDTDSFSNPAYIWSSATILNPTVYSRRQDPNFKHGCTRQQSLCVFCHEINITSACKQFQ